MVYFKQDETYDRYLSDLLDWALELERKIKQGEEGMREPQDEGERKKLALELEELIEEIKHCQVAIWHELKPDYLEVLYQRAANLYERIDPFVLGQEDLSPEKQTDSPLKNANQTAEPSVESAEIPMDEVRKGKGGQNRPVPIGGHKLPPLPYAYDALEPYISAEIMRLHHLKHHQSYVDGLNRAELELEKARRTGQFKLLRHWQREASFNGSGHALHTIFWYNLSPQGGGKPKGDLARKLQQDFGSFEQFQKHFSEAAKQVEGAGWAMLVWSARSHRLEIVTAEKHQHFAQWDVIPLLVLDVWEHAYYLQYKNDRAKYVQEWWNVVNWDDVEERFQKARTLKWTPY